MANATMTKQIPNRKGDVSRQVAEGLRPHEGVAQGSSLYHDLDELESLRDAVENLGQGIVLVNKDFCVQLVNKKARGLWGLNAEQCRSRPTVREFMEWMKKAGFYDVGQDVLDEYLDKREALIRSGDPTPVDIPVRDGRTIRAQCTPLAGGGRMFTYTDVTDLVQHARQQEILATTDVLTGLHNRRHFLKIAAHEWDRFRRYGHNICLLYFDIDNFKEINDRMGHDAGDKAIVQVAQVCGRVKRASDIVARMGGDEFVVLLPETQEDAGLAFASRLSAALSEEGFLFETHRTQLTISIGIAQARSALSDVSELLRIADARLYRAKAAGRNCIVWQDTSELTGSS